MKRWTPVAVEWRDCHGGDGGWEDPKELQQESAKMATVGFLYRQTDQGITVVLSRDYDMNKIGGYIFIPDANITRLTELAPKRSGHK